MANSHKNTVILARVSSKAQEEEGYSLESQLKLMQNYCAGKGLNIVKVFRIAETASKDQSRAVFKQLTQHIKQNKVYNLVVEKTDRLTRNLRDAVAINDWLEADSNRYLHIVKESLLLHKEARSDVKFMWNIHLAVAKKYTDNLREEAMKGWAEKLAQGWMPAPSPVGYMTKLVDGKKVHAPNPETSDCIRRIFRLYLEDGQSITSATEALRSMNVTSRTGRPLPRSYVEKILKNPFYAGTIRFNGREYPGAHQPLISQELFQAVQDKLGRGKLKSGRNKHAPLFQGLVKCQRCKRLISWSLQKGRYYGTCSKTKAACRNRAYVRQDRAEMVITSQLEQLVCPSKSLMAWLVRALNAKREQLSASFTANRQEIELRRKRLSSQLDVLYDDRLAGYISLEKYQAKSKQIEAELESLDSQLSDSGAEAQKEIDGRISIVELSQKAPEIYAQGDTHLKRQVIGALFEGIETDGPEVKVKLTKLADLITNNVRSSKRAVREAKMAKNGSRTTQKDDKNWGESGQLEILRPIWLAR